MKKGKKVISGEKASRRNSYNFLRLLGAILVIFSHSFALTGHVEPHFGDSTVSLGKLGVWIFFIISGYLISISWEQYPRFNVFMAKRALRIFPALIVVVLLTIIGGAILSELPIKQYILSQGTWDYLNNIFLFNTIYALPGVFVHNVHSGLVNGSLWTLAYEFSMYIAIAFIGVLRIYKKISPFAIWLSLLALNLIVSIAPSLTPNINLFYLNIGLLLPLALMYFSGVMFHKYSKLLATNLLAGLVAFGAFVGLTILFPNYAPIFGSTLLAFAVFAIGSHPFMSGIQKYGDISYGMYIYAFPVQQAIVHITGTSNPWKMFAASLMISSVCGALSWYLIEKPFLGLKNRIDTKRYPLSTADAW